MPVSLRFQQYTFICSDLFEHEDQRYSHYFLMNTATAVFQLRHLDLIIFRFQGRQAFFQAVECITHAVLQNWTSLLFKIHLHFFNSMPLPVSLPDSSATDFLYNDCNSKFFSAAVYFIDFIKSIWIIVMNRSFHDQFYNVVSPHWMKNTTAINTNVSAVTFLHCKLSSFCSFFISSVQFHIQTNFNPDLLQNNTVPFI